MPNLVSVKAGRCLPKDDDPKKMVPSDVPGTLSLSTNPEDQGLIHFGWTPRKGQTVDEELDLIIFPGDATFTPYTKNDASKSGRIFVLKFSSSSQRYLFWLQAKAEGAASEHSQQDKLVGRKINRILETGGEIDENITEEELLAEGGAMDLDDDEGAEASRRGGEDGGRAANTNMSQNDLVKLLRGIQVPGSSSGPPQQTRQAPSSLLTLNNLLSTSETVPLLESKEIRDALLAHLPPTMVANVSNMREEKELLKKVLHSPQFAQAAAMMTVALREGGLKGVADSLGVKLDLSKNSSLDGVEIFLEGVKNEAEADVEPEADKKDKGDDDAAMGNT